jgi:branched-chain amino acid transport system ATP-binding protein
VAARVVSEEAPALSVRGLRKNFGGLVATDIPHLDVQRGSIHALIGPNGAGKSTFIAQVTGTLKSDSGEIRVAGTRIDSLPAHRRVMMGLARSFQTTTLCPDLTVFRMMALATHRTDGEAGSLWRRASTNTARIKRTEQLLHLGELTHISGKRVADLSYGEQRELEICLALALEPRLLLLDEPLAGLGPSEAERVLTRISALRGTMTVLLVEHDLRAVFRAADRISVLVSGRIIVEGNEKTIRASDEARRAYLGTGD